MVEAKLKLEAMKLRHGEKVSGGFAGGKVHSATIPEGARTAHLTDDGFSFYDEHGKEVTRATND